MANEIIIYRSPMEKMAYDFWMQPDNFVHGVIAIGAVILIAVAIGLLRDKWTARKRRIRLFGR